MLLIVIGVLLGFAGGFVAWREFDSRVLHPGLADAGKQFEKLNHRPPLPVAETASYTALGRRVVVPDGSYQHLKGLNSGGLTPEAFASLSKGQITGAALRSGGLQRAYLDGWVTPKQDRAIFVVLTEFRDTSLVRQYTDAQLNSSEAAMGAKFATVAMHTKGIAARASQGRAASNAYVVVAVCFRLNRTAYVTFAMNKKPREADFEWIRTHMRLQQAAL
ncbi:MAG: hypothetical protein ABI912_03430 [Actinomycetota bacterium]